MAVKKQFLKTKPICKVTFSIAAPDATSVVVAGDFNNWSESEFELKKLKSGTFKGTVNLETEKTYQFKYIIDGQWANDADADGSVFNEYASENSVLKL
jgi:1,4-alpha-glucan branching enzyme